MPALFSRRGSPVEGGLLPQLMLALCLCNPPPGMPFCHCWVRVGLLLSVLLLWVLGSGGGGVGKKSIAMTLCRAVLLGAVLVPLLLTVPPPLPLTVPLTTST